MTNMLMVISPKAIGFISIGIILLVLIGTIIASAFSKRRNFLIKSIIALISFVLAIFLAKPILGLFDNMFSLSSAFVGMYMNSFGNIESMNEILTNVNYIQAVENFKNTDIAISPTTKSFLVGVFEQQKLNGDQTTTLSVVASRTFSYLTSLFFVALLLYVFFYVITILVLKIILRKRQKSQDKKSPIITIPVGVLKGVVLVLVLIVCFSSLPLLSITNDYLKIGFEETKVLNSAYDTIVNTEQKILLEQIDWKEVYNSKNNSADDLPLGIYLDNQDEEQNSLNIAIISNSSLTQTLKIDGNTSISYFDYVCYANKIYLFDKVTKQYLGTYTFEGKDDQTKITASVLYDENKIYSTTVSKFEINWFKMKIKYRYI